MDIRKVSKTLISAVLAAILIIAPTGCDSVKSEKSRSESTSRSVSSKAPPSSKTESSLWHPSSSIPASIDESSDTPPAPSYPAEWDDSGIFSAYYEKAYKLMSNMTLDEKIGQMMLSSCPDDFGGDIARKYHLGGYLLFGKDFLKKDKNEVVNDISILANSQDIPMVTAADEEGGDVVRISSKPFLSDHEFKSPRQLYSEGKMKSIEADALEKAELMRSLGVTINLAPVCDISTDPYDFMYSRSLGQNAKITSEFVKSVTKISQDNGVSVALKHFPGYGNNSDTHTGIAIDKREMSEFEKKDFLPFKAGIDEGAHMVLVSHNIVNCMDDSMPASLSPKVINILRENLGFTGIVVTDDLSMQAIGKYTGKYTPAVHAVLAGNDMLTISENMLEESISSIKKAVEEKVIDQKIIDRSVMRILAWKYSKNMM